MHFFQLQLLSTHNKLLKGQSNTNVVLNHQNLQTILIFQKALLLLIMYTHVLSQLSLYILSTHQFLLYTSLYILKQVFLTFTSKLENQDLVLHTQPQVNLSLIKLFKMIFHQQENLEVFFH